ncbi:hypothetical protein GUJ93_ZPchr0012g21824 [Zizania palustris]|uniref:Uncharacterized protein n=1 Tax=Zizania palustris TaxID=103762 RepID=A0A8J5WX16_ZIZPA|nr:hypothetical protein GUJ93_ZPchr0012g21824 [Zizania palustris]
MSGSVQQTTIELLAIAVGLFCRNRWPKRSPRTAPTMGAVAVEKKRLTWFWSTDHCAYHMSGSVQQTTVELLAIAVGLFRRNRWPKRSPRTAPSVGAVAVETERLAWFARVRKNIEQLAVLVRSYPLSDPEDEQIQDMMDKIRLKFRVITASLGAKLEYEGRPTSSKHDVEDL